MSKMPQEDLFELLIEAGILCEVIMRNSEVGSAIWHGAVLCQNVLGSLVFAKENEKHTKNPVVLALATEFYYALCIAREAELTEKQIDHLTRKCKAGEEEKGMPS